MLLQNNVKRYEVDHEQYLSTNDEGHLLGDSGPTMTIYVEDICMPLVDVGLSSPISAVKYQLCTCPCITCVWIQTFH
ncbi:hypothetical protein DPMN_159219 [Dreissena polymorpha]|uniref:Uncharacterized protein n=1 Tax=Dreissena polymorpha TaxID=45954 RepID=A0A9D4EJC2_DREPO|nr:hypothetical protein DPMN_159219 [Dreissena polymorpha]